MMTDRHKHKQIMIMDFIFRYFALSSWRSIKIGPGAAYEWSQLFTAELLFSAFLCLTYLVTATSRKQSVGDFAAFAIGAAFTVGAFGGRGLGVVSINLLSE